MTSNNMNEKNHVYHALCTRITHKVLSEKKTKEMSAKESLYMVNEMKKNPTKIRFLKNIMGLWLIQESRRQWKREGKDYGFADLETFFCPSSFYWPCFYSTIPPSLLSSIL